MHVDPADGTCRTCGGCLEIAEADDATMLVECEDCGESYSVEPDAFGDGCMKYYVPFMAETEGGDE